MPWWNKTSSGPVGLIAGQGEFPLLFAQAAHSVGREVVLFGIQGLVDPRIEPLAKEAYFVGLGGLGQLVEYIKRSKVRQVVLAGGIPKTEIYNPRFGMDDTAKGFIHSNGNKGDDHLLRAFEVFLKLKAGVSVADACLFLKDALAPKGVWTKRAPSKAEWDDLKFGYKIIRGIGKLDIGQTVVVKHGVVLAVEAIEGTDAAIRRGGELGRTDVVVVKAAKPSQDLRFDLPCIGMDTLGSMKASSARVLGVQSGRTIVLDRKKLIEEADRENLSIVGL